MCSIPFCLFFINTILLLNAWRSFANSPAFPDVIATLLFCTVGKCCTCHSLLGFAKTAIPPNQTRLRSHAHICYFYCFISGQREQEISCSVLQSLFSISCAISWNCSAVALLRQFGKQLYFVHFTRLRRSNQARAEWSFSFFAFNSHHKTFLCTSVSVRMWSY